jgi:MGT family glycosyltransferase
VLPRLLQAAGAEPPDLVVGDSFAPWGRFLSALTGIPRVNLVSTLAFNRELAETMAPVKAAGPVVSDAHGAAAYSRHRTGLLKEFPSLGGLTPLDLFTNEAALNIVALPECLQPQRTAFGPTFRFTGAMYPHRRTPQELPLPTGFPRPLVYVSLGTVVNRDPEFFRRCALGLAGIGGTLLMTTGGGVSARELGCDGPNIHLLDHAPQFEVLGVADVFVSHGGVNGVRESLWHGVPMVTRPVTTEHQLLAMEVEREGAALRLPQGGGDPGGIREAVEQVLADPAFRTHAVRLGDGMRRAGGPARAADLIEEHVPRGSP